MEIVPRPGRFGRRKIIGGLIGIAGFYCMESSDIQPEVDYNNRRQAKDPNLGSYPDWTKGSLRFLIGVGLVFTSGYLIKKPL